jgi:large subunit ribosomal protein L22
MTAARDYVGATAKFVRVTPRKARLVADNVRGRSVPEARTILAFTQRAAARDVEKVLKSAVANAESNPKLRWNGDDLLIASITVDEGPTQKRWTPRARGRASQILKRSCHITIKLEPAPEPVSAGPAEEEKPRRRRRSAGGAAGAAEAKPKRSKKKEVAA